MRQILLPAFVLIMATACANQPNRKTDDVDTRRAAAPQPCSTLTPAQRRQRQNDMGYSDCEESPASRSQQNRNNDPLSGTVDSLGKLPDLQTPRLPVSQRFGL